jgi:hypothetical protein
MRIELLGLFKIRRLVIVGKLDLEDAAGQLQCRSPRLKLESRIDHLDSSLKGLVVHRNIGEVHVERGFEWIPDNGLAENFDCVGRVFVRLVDCRRQLHRADIRVGIQTRLQRSLAHPGAAPRQVGCLPAHAEREHCLGARRAVPERSGGPCRFASASAGKHRIPGELQAGNRGFVRFLKSAAPR